MAMKVIAAGSATSSADANEYFVNTKFAIKPGNEAVSSAPNLHNDTDLSLHVDASKTYIVDLFAQWASPVAASFQFAFSAPAGTILYGSAHIDTVLSTSLMLVYSQGGSGASLNTPFVLTSNGSGIADVIRVSGMLVTSGTAGNFTFRWCQNTSNAGNTTVYAGSSMLLRRVS